MTKNEFLDILRETLTGRVSSSTVTENVRYYEDYINTQVRMGKAEDEVVSGLGDPRLLARSIIDADKRSGRVNPDDHEQARDEQSYGSANGTTGKVYRMPTWLIVFFVIFVVFLILGVVFSVLSFLIPILLPILLVVLAIRLFRRI